MTSAERAIFEQVKSEILCAIDEIAKQTPEAAEYLRQHIEFNEVEGTVRYTGDDRIKLYGPFNFN